MTCLFKYICFEEAHGGYVCYLDVDRGYCGECYGSNYERVVNRSMKNGQGLAQLSCLFFDFGEISKLTLVKRKRYASGSSSG